MPTTSETNVLRKENPSQTVQTAESAVVTERSAVLEAAVADFVAKNRWREKALKCKANTDVVLVNVCRAVEALTRPDIEARIKKELPDFDLVRLRGATRLAQALNYIDHRVDPNGPATGKDKEDLLLGRKLREQFSTVIKMAVAFGVIPQAATKEMFKGNGKGSICHDLNNSVHLLQAHQEKLKNATLVTPDLLSKAEALAARMLMNRNIGSPLAGKGEVDVGEQVRVRDLLYTDLVECHEQMRRAAFWLWGTEMNKYVPPLRSAKKNKKAESAEGKATTPVETPAAVPAQPTVVLPFPSPAHVNGAPGTPGAQTVPETLTIERPGTMTPKLIVA